MTKIQSEQNEYFPDYAIPPGDTLSETLELLGMTQADLARRMGRPRKTINEIIQGKAAITPETALQLELVLGTPASFWNNLEQQYQETLARIAENGRLDQQADWLRKFPVADMCRKQWVSQEDNSIKQTYTLLGFFGVASVQQYDEIWDATFAQVNFRQSAARAINREATAAWLRKGELEAQAIHCTPYHAPGFRSVLEQVRPLTVKAIEDVWQLVMEKCAAAGVAIVTTPELPNTGIWGVSRWLNPQKALIQLSLRYKSDDQFWFSFFHEAGHILQHGKSKLYIRLLDEGKKSDETMSQEEEQANRFAADFLIPPAELRRFLRGDRRHISKDRVLQFADELRVAPGIVVGRLQHDGYLSLKNLNGLKRRLRWSEQGQVVTISN